MTSIEWVKNSDGSNGKSWNPIVGCSIISKGCRSCYAMKMAYRQEYGFETPHYAGTTKKVNGNAVWTGKVNLAPGHILNAPLTRKKPTTYFVNSMSDLFHEDVPDEWIDTVFAIGALCPQHTLQILTKRAERMSKYCNDPKTPHRIAKVMDALQMQPSGKEIIKPIPGYPGYFASSFGHIYTEKKRRRKKLKPDVGPQGHMRVQLHNDENGRYGDRKLVHRIVLETFIGPPPDEKSQACHRDGNASNNAIKNLKWGTQSDNWKDRIRHGNHRSYSKLSESQVKEIRERHAQGEPSEKLGEEYSVSGVQIMNIVRGDQWNVEAPIEWPLANCWLGISAEDQKRADERIPYLLDTPAAIRFVSAEPLLGQIEFGCIYDQRENVRQINALEGRSYPLHDADLEGTKTGKIDWIIVGCESGPKRRPMNEDWVHFIKNQCAPPNVSTKFFYKQSIENGKLVKLPLLDGREWTQMPEAAA